MLSHFSCVQLSATPWTAAHQVSLSMEFSRQEYWSGLPFPSPVRKYEVSEASELKSLSRVRLFVTPWTVAYQAPPSVEFSRQEYWSRLLFPSPKEAVVHIHNGILLSQKRNACESVLMRWMNLKPIIQSEVSHKEKDKYHILTLI